MTSVRAFDNLHCATCSELTLHQNRVCVTCGAPNNSSGAKPTVRPQLRFNSHTGKHFNPELEQAGARRRARQARHKAINRIRA